MAGVRKKNRNLPPHMAVRTYTNRKGDVWTGYYYERRDGKEKIVKPLGSDLALALKKWAELEGRQPVIETTMDGIFAKYIVWAEQRDLSGLSVRSVNDYRSHWKFLSPVFGKVPIDKMKPEYLLRYFEARSSQFRAKKEVKFVSTMFNWAKARGYTTIENPVTGITRQMKVPTKRTIYVRDEDYLLVYKHARPILQDAMDIALLTGQRPADVFKMQWSDIKDGVLIVSQNKTGAVVRIAIEGQLSDVLKRIKSRCVVNMRIVPMSPATFKRAFDDARNKAEAEAKEMGITFQRFQFKDLRAKAATDSASQTDAQKLLGHKNQATTVIYRRDKGEVISPLKNIKAV